MKHKFFLLLILFSVSLLASNIHAEAIDIHCHFSLVTGDVYVINPEQDEVVQATVNYPLLPGDTIYTNDKSRCEIQFSNGTLLRMDSHTDLKITSILSPALTTNFKITTLTLKKGQVFTMNQVYRKEIYQIITPLAAIKLNARSTNHIMINDAGETWLNVIRGKTGIMYNQEKKVADTKYLRVGKSCLIKKQGLEIEDAPKPDPDFILWNREINKNFKDLHYGKNKIPSVIYRRSPGIVHFAEKFSSLYGTWVFNDLFGYVWKPADFLFHDRRPFFDANYVEINGELVLVPNQAWGWAPAHLGTWFWSKTDGWTWIPGDGFSRGICKIGFKDISADYWVCVWYLVYPPIDVSAVSTLLTAGIENWFYYLPEYWITRIFGSMDLYHIYRQDGRKAWRQAYRLAFNQGPPSKKPAFGSVPENIRIIVRNLNQVHYQTIRNYFTEHKIGNNPKIFQNLIKIIDNRVKKDNLSQELINIMGSSASRRQKSEDRRSFFKADWNPDSAWAQRMGVKLIYSSRNNQVICPEFRVRSGNLNSMQKALLRRLALPVGSGNESNPSSSAGTSNAANSSVHTSDSPVRNSSDNGKSIPSNPGSKNR